MDSWIISLIDCLFTTYKGFLQILGFPSSSTKIIIFGIIGFAIYQLFNNKKGIIK
ncbi:MAG: hypothetical protein J6D02_07295 [Lachnospira sp.]|nr:hypothetical protein [Lachnospira sp.]